MTIDPFDTPETQHDSYEDAPLASICPTERPEAESGWARTELDETSSSYVEYGEDGEFETGEITISAYKEAIFLEINGTIVAFNDKQRVERFIRTIERAWDDHEKIIESTQPGVELANVEPAAVVDRHQDNSE